MSEHHEHVLTEDSSLCHELGLGHHSFRNFLLRLQSPYMMLPLSHHLGPRTRG